MATIPNTKSAKSKVKAKQPQSKPKASLLHKAGDFFKEKFIKRDPMVHECGRGELGICAAVTNRGKSTFLRNCGLCLACGRVFLPMVPGNKPRKVWLIDFETPSAVLQADLLKMQDELDLSEQKLIAENLMITCDLMLDDEPFLLSRSDHLDAVRKTAKDNNIDVIIIDTISGAFEIRSENDNSEVAAKIMKPVMRVARDANVCILLAHHIGKMGSEEGNAKEKAHLMRGASNFSGFASLVVNLTKGASPEASNLSVGKVKGTEFEEVVIKLDKLTRWFSSSDVKPLKTPSGFELLMAIFTDNREWKRFEVEAALADTYRRSAVSGFLDQAVKSGDLRMPRRGVYQKADLSDLSKQDNFIKPDNG